MAHEVGPLQTIGGLHPEDVKAIIRKRFGTIARFVEARGLPATGVSDLFRGRPSQRVREAVEEVLRDQDAAPTSANFRPCQACGGGMIRRYHAPCPLSCSYFVLSPNGSAA